MKRLRRVLNPVPVHMGPYGNEMCDHLVVLAQVEDCIDCKAAECRMAARRENLIVVAVVLHQEYLDAGIHDR